MLYRNKKEQDCNKGKWIGIGGKVEEGETPDECVRREVMEETGLQMEHFWQRGVIYFHSDIWESEEMYLYSCDKVSGELAETCREGELRWIPIEEVMGLHLWEGDRIFLKQMLEGRNDISLLLRYEGDDLVECKEVR